MPVEGFVYHSEAASAETSLRLAREALRMADLRFSTGAGTSLEVLDAQTAVVAGKTSLAFSVRNLPGALFKALSVFALRDISLTKIESRPMRGRPWEYVFFVDLLRGDDEAARNALLHLGEVAELVKVLGIYPPA